MSGCDNDIHTVHAELLHVARDIKFQLIYKNGILTASIICVGIDGNVQSVLESYFSQVGIPVHNEIPSGARNGINLVYGTADEFVPGSLEVWLSGAKLRGKQTDPDRDFTEALDRKGFTIILDPSKAHRLNVAPCQNEAFEINYGKRITFNTKGGT